MDRMELIFLGACLLAGGRWANPYYQANDDKARESVSRTAVKQAEQILEIVFEEKD